MLVPIENFLEAVYDKVSNEIENSEAFSIMIMLLNDQKYVFMNNWSYFLKY